MVKGWRERREGERRRRRWRKEGRGTERRVTG